MKQEDYLGYCITDIELIYFSGSPRKNINPGKILGPDKDGWPRRKSFAKIKNGAGLSAGGGLLGLSSVITAFRRGRHAQHLVGLMHL